MLGLCGLEEHLAGVCPYRHGSAFHLSHLPLQLLQMHPIHVYAHDPPHACEHVHEGWSAWRVEFNVRTYAIMQKGPVFTRRDVGGDEGQEPRVELKAHCDIGVIDVSMKRCVWSSMKEKAKGIIETDRDIGRAAGKWYPGTEGKSETSRCRYSPARGREECTVKPDISEGT